MKQCNNPKIDFLRKIQRIELFQLAGFSGGHKLGETKQSGHLKKSGPFLYH